MKIKERIFDITTNEEITIEREETAEEKIDRQKAENEAIEAEAKAKAKAAERLRILQRIGLTEEEAKLLLG